LIASSAGYSEEEKNMIFVILQPMKDVKAWAMEKKR
jgi:hypothetical protein